MKKLVLLTIAILFVNGNLVAEEEAWYPYYAESLKGYYLHKVYALNTDTVFIIGADNFPGYEQVTVVINKSTDGGRTWTHPEINLNGVMLTDIVFYNDETGYITGEKGTLLKTTDGGDTWFLLPIATEENINALALPSINNGWIVGDNGLVMQSTDEGETWRKIDLNTTEKLNDVSFRNNEGYIAGNNAAIFKTEDAGNSWNSLEIDSELMTGDYALTHILSLGLTENHVYALNRINSAGGLPIKINEVNNIYPTMQMSSFAMQNDSTGYGVFAASSTGSGDFFEILKKKDGYSFFEDIAYTLWERVGGYRTYEYSIRDGHSDICIVNNSVAYAVSGNILLKKGGILTDIKALNYNKSGVNIFRQGKTLSITADSSPILSIELFDLSGRMLKVYAEPDGTYRKQIDLSGIQQDVVLIRGILVNGEHFSAKYLR